MAGVFDQYHSESPEVTKNYVMCEFFKNRNCNFHFIGKMGCNTNQSVKSKI